MNSVAAINGLIEEWEAGPEVELVHANGQLTLHNRSRQKQSLRLKRSLSGGARSEGSFLSVSFRGEMLEGSGVSLTVREGEDAHYPAPLNSLNRFELGPRSSVRVHLELNGQASVRLDALELAVSSEQPDLLDGYLEEGSVLLVTPTYPSSHHLYLSGFVHARVREYQKQGLKPVVFCSFTAYQYQTVYDFEGVRVLRGHVTDLLRALSERQFKKVLVHFFDEFYAHVLDKALKNTSTELILWCHGPETLFWDLPAVTGPYFSKAHGPDAGLRQKYELLQHYARKFNERRNVRWVFVSEWQRRRSEELLGITFRNAQVIPNYIDESIFTYRPRLAEQRKHIFMLRRFDNEKKYAVDLAVMAIIELSKKPFFQELQFHIYGDGGCHQQLLAPIAQLPNVHLHRRFIDHETITQVHAGCGVALFPTRYDAQGVSACEAASSGLVVVSSDNTAIPEFLPKELGTLASAEDARELAAIVERLYAEPERFLDVSRRMSEHVRTTCGYASTIQREIALIQEEPREEPVRVPEEKEKLLTVVVPTYNMQGCLERCVASMVDTLGLEELAALEVLIVDDGSTDSSLEVARRLEAQHPRVVRVVSKPNGGHGSTINTGLAEARGRYFRVLDSDDYVDSYDFRRFVQRLATETADVVVTDYCEDWAGSSGLTRRDIYTNLTPETHYSFETLADPTYGFGVWGPVLATGTFKTECLRKAGLRLDEKIAYVDMEYNALSLTYVDSVTYYPLDVYRYTLGRPNQTVSREAFKRKHKQHAQVIRRICDFIEGTPQLSDGKRRYVLQRILRPMIDGHYGLLIEDVRDREELREFDALIQGYRCLEGLTFEKREGGLLPSLDRLRRDAKKAARNALPFTFVANLDEQVLANHSKTAKYIIKYFAPYGLVMRLKR